MFENCGGGYAIPLPVNDIFTGGGEVTGGVRSVVARGRRGFVVMVLGVVGVGALVARGRDTVREWEGSEELVVRGWKVNGRFM